MIDANNGYNLNLAKRVLAETADCRLLWIEEPFHEDAVLYRDLKEWLAREGLAALIADGEGQASPSLLDWAREGLIDVVQYDVFHSGFTRWLEIGRQLDDWGRLSAPHHYGGFFGNFTSGHLAGALRGLLPVEWDEAAVPGVDTSRYVVREGWVDLPTRLASAWSSTRPRSLGRSPRAASPSRSRPASTAAGSPSVGAIARLASFSASHVRVGRSRSRWSGWLRSAGCS